MPNLHKNLFSLERSLICNSIFIHLLGKTYINDYFFSPNYKFKQIKHMKYKYARMYIFRVFVTLCNKIMVKMLKQIIMKNIFSSLVSLV